MNLVRNADGERCRMSCVKKRTAEIGDGLGSEAIQ
jgi:hypothetical protein